MWTQNNAAPAGMGTAIPANNGVIRIRFQLFNGDGSMHGVGGFGDGNIVLYAQWDWK